MKRFFAFQNKPKNLTKPQPTLTTATPPKPTNPSKTSPTLSKRPTARNENEIWQSLQVIVTEGALLIRPVHDAHRGHLKLNWGVSASVLSVDDDRDDLDWDASSLPIYGIVGTTTLTHTSYVLVITAVDDLGNLNSTSRQVYGVKDVVAIPLEYTRAANVVNRLVARIKRRGTINVLSNNGGTGAAGETGSLHVKWAPQHAPNVTPDATSVLSSSPTSSGHSTPTTGVVAIAPLAKTIADRLSFWKSRRDSSLDEGSLIVSKASGHHDTLGELLADIDNGDTANIEPEKAIDDIITAAAAPEPHSVEQRNLVLEDKITKEMIRQFTKGGMYFSYTFADLSNSLQRKQQQVERLKKRESILSDLDALGDWSTLETCEGAQPFKEPLVNLPLWRRIDRRFWWNEHMLQSFVEAELHAYVLPILQGYFQIASFPVPDTNEPHEYTPTAASDSTLLDKVTETITGKAQSTIELKYAIISRRSKERAGLRYQRRGIDDDANVANFVETETIVHLIREGQENVFSFVQVRGSIPLYWSQAGYGLKPPPQLDTSRTRQQSLSVMKSHFTTLSDRYGPTMCVNLAEQHGKEGPITDAYRTGVQEVDLPDTKWDFHAECRGMRYENISKLIHQMERTFERQGFYWISGTTVMSQQRGVFRVNCIDCLDRTNVVQSAFARHVLTSQMEALALLDQPGESHTVIENGFNDVWANNGDAISREYAGTSALKGDFTRTGKRDLSGLLNDGINSLARVYTSTFSDWFSQSVIDFMLGYRNVNVFAEFLQNLSSSDPRDALRLSKVREAAVQQTASIVIPEEEKLAIGWTLLSPMEFDTKLADRFEEKILLLTHKAIYIVSYDYSLEKVKKSTRVPLGDIVGVQKGPYILSTLNSQTQDTRMNYGVVISFLAARQDTRVTSYSLRNRYTPQDTKVDPTWQTTPGVVSSLSQILSGTHTSSKVVSVAFKALPVDTTHKTQNMESPGVASTPREMVDKMVNVLIKLCDEFGVVDDQFVREQDIVSIAEAQRSTTLYARFEYNLKRMLWLGS
ncbi:hypothetical protein CPB86DRAFT_861460 [Serendipita vermifera]|nr:hypothetical protein CPB86DRAFT_861460 [Serendipita vermifera]